MTLPTTTDTVMLDVRDRLARIEVKIDNTNDTLMRHDQRITSCRSDIDSLKDELAIYRTKVKTIVWIAAPILPAGLWILDHLSLFATLKSG